MGTAGRKGEWGTLVSQGTQGVGGAFTPIYEDVGAQVAGYGTALGEATQYGIATQDSVSGVLQGITNAGLVAQGSSAEQIEELVPGEAPEMTSGEVPNLPGATTVVLVP